MRFNRSKHPWPLWLDGNEHALIPGRDFTAQRRTLYFAAKRAAKLRGIRVQVVDLGERVIVKARTA